MRWGLFGLGGAIAIVGMLAGCGRDPYERDDVWYPTGANNANLAAQIVNPRDLQVGRSDPKQMAAPQVKAVERINTDTPKALPIVSSSTTIGGGSGGGGGGTGGGGSTGGAPGGN